VMEPEIFDRVTESWTTDVPMQVPRLYHSTALLLPDGRVWVAGTDG
jgi:galactose oxidase